MARLPHGGADRRGGVGRDRAGEGGGGAGREAPGVRASRAGRRGRAPGRPARSEGVAPEPGDRAARRGVVTRLGRVVVRRRRPAGRGGQRRFRPGPGCLAKGAWRGWGGGRGRPSGRRSVCGRSVCGRSVCGRERVGRWPAPPGGGSGGAAPSAGPKRGVASGSRPAAARAAVAAGRRGGARPAPGRPRRRCGWWGGWMAPGRRGARSRPARRPGRPGGGGGHRRRAGRPAGPPAVNAAPLGGPLCRPRAGPVGPLPSAAAVALGGQEAHEPVGVGEGAGDGAGGRDQDPRGTHADRHFPPAVGVGLRDGAHGERALHHALRAARPGSTIHRARRRAGHQHRPDRLGHDALEATLAALMALLARRPPPPADPVPVPVPVLDDPLGSLRGQRAGRGDSAAWQAAGDPVGRGLSARAVALGSTWRLQRRGRRWLRRNASAVVALRVRARHAEWDSDQALSPPAA